MTCGLVVGSSPQGVIKHIRTLGVYAVSRYANKIIFQTAESSYDHKVLSSRRSTPYSLKGVVWEPALRSGPVHMASWIQDLVFFIKGHRAPFALAKRDLSFEN